VTTASVRAGWARGQKGWPARYPLVQFPNAPLLLSLLASVVHRLADGTLADHAWVVSRLALAVWAWEELVRGDNAVRRVLGLVALVLITHGLVDRLG
jgi:hypothetical protein